ncbi:hypothetical protein APUTEX25_003117 [Auxenochlorella protothecoides]|uniref:Uncharacterized protein n=1 Tax=Auxenochlorella protothecoides TaxID=3075 RepID=A0A3M7KXX5_AUXPR|nr:hypothetical protein APUTEX25_003117 [Auxenochlorella protothecoides]|eukprot:RMZ54739.1 hypothetical protein APUTEX25_003117 [Auxenochlorella protothecoides]
MQLHFRLASQCNVRLGLCSLGEEESGVSSCSISHVPTSIETRPSLTNERYKGFSKSGSIRTSTLNIMGLSMSAIRMSTLEIMTPRFTEILVAVECLKAGHKACTADSNGNIGSDNKGKNNFGTNNVGDDNIGNSNVGTANWGDGNKGKGNRCFNKTGDRKIINDCSLLEFGKHALVLAFPPPPAKNGSVTKNVNDFSFSVNIVDVTPDRVRWAFFTAAGGLIRASREVYSTPMSWTTTLESSETALASHAQVVAYKFAGGTSNALTLNW